MPFRTLSSVPGDSTFDFPAWALDAGLWALKLGVSWDFWTRLAFSSCPSLEMKVSTLLSLAFATPALAIFQLGCGEACNGVIDGFELDCTPGTKQHHGTCELF